MNYYWVLSQENPLSTGAPRPVHTGRSSPNKKHNVKKLVTKCSPREESERRTSAGESILVPTSRAGQSNNNVRNRWKFPKVAGADIYVVRLAGRASRSFQALLIPGEIDDGEIENIDGCCSLTSSRAPSTGSLHDELIDKGPPRVPVPLSTTTTSSKVEHVLMATESRPCYRCVCYMHSVGIKRVFWSNWEGKWESAKVRDLFDDLSSGSPGAGADFPAGAFVTRHEVLALKRVRGLVV